MFAETAFTTLRDCFYSNDCKTLIIMFHAMCHRFVTLLAYTSIPQPSSQKIPNNFWLILMKKLEQFNVLKLRKQLKLKVNAYLAVTAGCRHQPFNQRLKPFIEKELAFIACHNSKQRELVVNPGKHQSRKQRGQVGGWKVHDRAHFFVFHSCAMHELRNRNVVIGQLHEHT